MLLEGKSTRLGGQTAIAVDQNREKDKRRGGKAIDKGISWEVLQLPLALTASGTGDAQTLSRRPRCLFGQPFVEGYSTLTFYFSASSLSPVFLIPTCSSSPIPPLSWEHQETFGGHKWISARAVLPLMRFPSRKTQFQDS